MFLLALTLLHPASAGWPFDTMNTDGPGSGDERKAGMSSWWGAPLEGYHVVTITTDKPWNEKIGDHYNQHIAADLPDSAAAILKDPANGLSGKEKYTWEDSFFDIKEGQKNAGYPKRVPLPESVTTLLTGNQQYRDIAGEKDYMLLFFGAGWCKKCQDFTPRLAKYYAAHKDDKEKTFDVVYFSDDDDSQKYDEFVKTMPWKGLGYDMTLTWKLKSLLTLHSVPTVVVIDKQGQTVTIEGAEAIQGTKKVEAFPLADGAEFWKDQTPEQAGAGDCSTDIAEQVKALKDAVKAKTDKLSGAGLQHYAEKVAGSDTLPTGDAELREYVVKKYDTMIDTAAAGGDADARKRVQALYEALDEEENNPSNQTFKVGETVEVLTDFTSDAKGSIMAMAIKARTRKGSGYVTNTGYITKVEQDPNSIYTKSIQVRFAGDIYHTPWVNADKFEFLRKVEESPRSKSDRPRY
jgi:thiol-disulfide isomerase/thioredoxin